MASTNSRYLNEHVETMPREQIHQLQEHKLGAILDYACERSPLIASVWEKAGIKPGDISSLEDFAARAPCFDKDDIRAFRDTHNDPTGGLARLSDIDLNKIATTSGTTGDPTPFPIRVRASSDEGYARDFWEMGARPGEYAILATFTFRIGIGNHPFINTGAVPILFRHDPHQIPRMADAIRKFKPTLFSLMSTPMLLGFEKCFKESGVDPWELFAPIKRVLYGGERLGPRLKATSGRRGLRLFATPGVGEVVSVTEWGDHRGFDARDEMTIAECHDPNGNSPVGNGEVAAPLVTTLANPEV